MVGKIKTHFTHPARLFVTDTILGVTQFKSHVQWVCKESKQSRPCLRCPVIMPMLSRDHAYVVPW